MSDYKAHMRSDKTDATLNVAILGLGSIGLRHARNALELGASVTGYDLDPERRAIAGEAGVNVHDTRDAAIKSSEFAVISTPSIHHADDLDACVGKVRRVLVEKPLTHDPEATLPVLERARSASMEVFCGFNLRFHETVCEAKRVIEDKALGQILWASVLASSDLRDWRPGQDVRKNYTNHPEAGGVLFDYSHEIDLAHYLLGSGELAFSHIAQSNLLGLQVEDIATVGVQHKNGSAIDDPTRLLFKTRHEVSHGSRDQRDPFNGLVKAHPFTGGRGRKNDFHL